MPTMSGNLTASKHWHTGAVTASLHPHSQKEAERANREIHFRAFHPPPSDTPFQTRPHICKLAVRACGTLLMQISPGTKCLQRPEENGDKQED